MTRLGTPVLRLPAMRAFGRLADGDLVRRAAEALGSELAALGITMNFAPVLDVNTCPENPVIGDRSFCDEPDGRVAARARRGCAACWRGACSPCGKHFPGHGDTTEGLALRPPGVDHARRTAPRGRRELALPRTAARRAPAVMTAHVVYPAPRPRPPRDPVPDRARAPASSAFRGCIVSDDLEMRAIADRVDHRGERRARRRGRLRRAARLQERGAPGARGRGAARSEPSEDAGFEARSARSPRAVRRDARAQATAAGRTRAALDASHRARWRARHRPDAQRDGSQEDRQ